jgi:hypothetical protein
MRNQMILPISKKPLMQMLEMQRMTPKIRNLQLQMKRSLKRLSSHIPLTSIRSRRLYTAPANFPKTKNLPPRNASRI